MAETPDREGDERPRRGALIGLLVVLALVVAGVWLFHALRKESQLEDCLMSGRSNCAPIELPARGSQGGGR
jgi:hypothetical protein